MNGSRGTLRGTGGDEEAGCGDQGRIVKYQARPRQEGFPGRRDKAIIRVVKERSENMGEPVASVTGGKQG